MFVTLRLLAGVFVYVVRKDDLMIICSPKPEVKILVDGIPEKLPSCLRFFSSMRILALIIVTMNVSMIFKLSEMHVISDLENQNCTIYQS